MPRDRHRHDLYPPIDASRTGYLEVGDGHTLYFEESGRPDGVPMLFLHGGPGAGASPNHRRFFDPAHYRIIVFDQRGAGRSRPLGSVEANTTRHLIGDMEALRQHLGVDRWHLFGGSWGSTLALAYAQAYPAHALSLTLRGVFLMTRREINWFLFGMRAFFPDHWQRFIGFLPEEERNDPLRGYYKRLMSSERTDWLPAAQMWSRYESACSTLLPSPDALNGFIDESHALSLARIEAHYFIHNLFDPEDSLIAGVDRIRHLPCVIVQGRYDAVCPPEAAFRLHAAWPEAQLVIVPDAGHSAMEPGIRAALVAATEGLKSRSF